MSAIEYKKGKSWHFCGNGCKSQVNGPSMAQTLVCIVGRPINGSPSRSYYCPKCVTEMKDVWAGALFDPDDGLLPAVAA